MSVLDNFFRISIWKLQAKSEQYNRTEFNLERRLSGLGDCPPVWSCIETTFYMYQMNFVDVSNQVQFVSNRLVLKRL